MRQHPENFGDHTSSEGIFFFFFWFGSFTSPKATNFPSFVAVDLAKEDILRF